jgi:EAL domain-containing protein (putative c-di-GMP-specific phosphodiesterase class I)
MVVELGRNLNLTVIAEGIEDEAQAETLLRMGCHEGQGYLYAKPMVPQQLKEWLQARLASR